MTHRQRGQPGSAGTSMGSSRLLITRSERVFLVQLFRVLWMAPVLTDQYASSAETLRRGLTPSGPNRPRTR
jgi:hypothetical protein